MVDLILDWPKHPVRQIQIPSQPGHPKVEALPIAHAPERDRQSGEAEIVGSIKAEGAPA